MPAEEQARTEARPNTQGSGLYWARLLAFVMLAVAGLVVFPSLYCAKRGKAYLGADSEARARVMRGAAFQGEVIKNVERFHTGSARYDGQWMLLTYTMTAVAAGQLAVRDLETTSEAQIVMKRAVERCVRPASRAFDADAWQGEDALDALGDDSHGHGASLAYLGLALGWDRMLNPEGAWSDLHDGVAAALERRLVQAPAGVFASFPDEFSPADAAVAAAAVALHAKSTGHVRPESLDRWESTVRAKLIDPESGLLYQRVGETGATADSRPRATGTALAAWVLASSHPGLSRELWEALRTSRMREVIGFAGMRDYATGESGVDDPQTGPTWLGLSPAATVFSMGAARAHNDLRSFSRLYASVHLLGAPVDGDERRNFAAAGPLGDAVLAASLTTLDAGTYGSKKTPVRP